MNYKNNNWSLNIIKTSMYNKLIKKNQILKTMVNLKI